MTNLQEELARLEEEHFELKERHRKLQQEHAELQKKHEALDPQTIERLMKENQALVALNAKLVADNDGLRPNPGDEDGCV